MAMTGRFETSSIQLLNEPWFERRWKMELQVLAEDGSESAGFVEASALRESERFPGTTHLAFDAIMRSRRAPDQLYAVEVVLPANWPWGEPLAYMIEPELGLTTMVNGHRVPHLYSGDALCTHVAHWDTRDGKSTLSAYLFVVAIWWACFEEFVRRDGQMDYSAWCRAADWLIAHWAEDWSLGVPTT